MTDPLSFEQDPQAGEEQAIASAAFATGVGLEVVRVVYEAVASQVQRAVYARIADHVLRLAQEDDGSAPAAEVLRELGEQLAAELDPDARD